MTDHELLERLAAIEHERWAGWQRYLHSKCIPRPDGDGPKLRRIPARVRFYSMEPLLEDVDCYYAPPPDWIIVGGESGRNARPMAEQWCLKIARYCEGNNVPMFMKQGSAANWPHWKEFDRWHAELRVREFPLLREDA